VFGDLAFEAVQLECQLTCRIERIHIRDWPIALDQLPLYLWDSPFLLCQHVNCKIEISSARCLQTTRLLRRAHVRLSLESKFSEV